MALLINYDPYPLHLKSKMSFTMRLFTLSSGHKRKRDLISENSDRAVGTHSLWQAATSAHGVKLNFQSLLQFKNNCSSLSQCHSMPCFSKVADEYISNRVKSVSNCTENCSRKPDSVSLSSERALMREQQLGRIAGLQEELCAAERLVESLRAMIAEAEDICRIMDKDVLPRESKPIQFCDFDLIEISDAE